MQWLTNLVDELRARLGGPRTPWEAPPLWVDLHCHVLPAIDDGARNLDTALAMLARAEALGITHVVATPHYSDVYAPSWEAIDDACAAVRAALSARGNALTLLCGREVSFTDQHVEAVRSDDRFRIGATRCVLMELSGVVNRTALIQGFFELSVEGVRAIAAHPERNPLVQDQPELVEELRSRGVMIQMDAGSVVGRHGAKAQRTAWHLLATQNVDFLNSDAHRVSHYDDYERALQKVYRRFGAQALQKTLSDAPRHVLNL